MALELAFMKVEDTLRYLGKRFLNIKQFKVGENTNHFFLTKDIEKIIGVPAFREMEVHVVQLIIVNPKISVHDLERI